ncbi:MAG TPA: ABC transporter ATP-binding protein [Bacteroidales bacterium]|jgi:ABC-2 type transport system ATP-binding protein|nr:ABC transporter ATP-binding protein [Bacteroidales bacterium]
MPERNVIEVKKVWKSFKTVQAVKGIDLKIPEGTFVALLGPNGAGKTTLVEMIEGIQKPDSGEITIIGRHWKGNEDELHKIIGLSLQETRFIDKLRVSETLKLFASFFNLGMKKVDEIIELVGLEEKRRAYVVNLSGGQRQRLAIGIALINSPAILLLDEPTTGLDPNARREIWDILMNLKMNSKTSMILTTHYMEEAENLCDLIVIIDKGQILREGTLQQLLVEDSSGKVVEFTAENPFHAETLNAGSSFKVSQGEAGEKGTVVLNDFENDLPLFMAYVKSKNISLKHMECRRRTLDDLFVSLTGRKINE